MLKIKENNNVIYKCAFVAVTASNMNNYNWLMSARNSSNNAVRKAGEIPYKLIHMYELGNDSVLINLTLYQLLCSKY